MEKTPRDCIATRLMILRGGGMKSSGFAAGRI
jgi:hypothetical protein